MGERGRRGRAGKKKTSETANARFQVFFFLCSLFFSLFSFFISFHHLFLLLRAPVNHFRKLVPFFPFRVI